MNELFNMWLILSLIVLAFVLTSCGGASSISTSTSSGHVFLIIMENKSYDQALGGEYAASLVSQYAVATDYHAVAHPSLPNYLALTSGSTWSITDDEYHALPSGEDLGSELTSADIPWRAYMEDMSDGCFDSPKPYSLHHNPFAYYGGQCPSNVVPLSQLDADLSGNTPNFVWITPNNCHNAHDCSVSTADQWLEEIVPKITESEAWKEDGVLFIVWDEDDYKNQMNNRVPLIVVAPDLKSQRTDDHYDHYSLLATIQDRLGIERLGEAINATPLEGLFWP